jgi:tRNA pseudouridine38-40 synthase
MNEEAPEGGRPSVREEDSGAAVERTFRLVVEYDGAGFEGWQIQAGERVSRTIQGSLVEAVESITRTPARIRGAGRTDAGVHALGQVASLVVETTLSSLSLGRAIHSRLPPDVAIVGCDEVPREWDALREARSKLYRYQIWNGRGRSPVRAPRWCWIRDALNVEEMRTAGKYFVGTHDFASLRAAGSDVKTTVRTLTRLRMTGQSRGEIVLEVEGEGFLRHMVRNLAGTLIEVGRGRWPASQVAEILAAADRSQAGPTAPAEGLSLVEVHDSFSQGEVEKIGSRAVSVDDEGPVG